MESFVIQSRFLRLVLGIMNPVDWTTAVIVEPVKGDLLVKDC